VRPAELIVAQRASQADGPRIRQPVALASDAVSVDGIVEDGIVRGDDGIRRCWWGDSAPEYRGYHDREWGFPVADDARLFEKLSLEGFQAGLSWLTILRKRESFRRAFAGFQFERIARFGERDVERLLADSSIVRHRGKIEAVINNARRAIELVEREGSLAGYIWRFEPPARRSRLVRAGLAELASTPESSALARDLKRRGWRFVGPTTVYAFMQAMGLVNDHLHGCDAQPAVERARAQFVRPTSARPDPDHLGA
jgi:DNA-3-methyladenine glycosylase I